LSCPFTVDFGADAGHAFGDLLDPSGEAAVSGWQVLSGLGEERHQAGDVIVPQCVV
jgi:hypothetical protein